MFLQTYGAALLVILVSAVIGRAACVACGADGRWWAAPLVGLASLLVLAGAAIQLPGRPVPAIVVCAFATAAGIGVLVRHRLPPLSVGDVLTGGLAMAVASLPFLANDRLGVLGAGLNNDMAVHLLWAEGLRSDRMARLWGVVDGTLSTSGYPLGPHSIVAVFGSTTGIPLDAVFTGLSIAVISLTAVVAAGIVGSQSLWRRLLMGLMCSLPYLVAAFYAEGAFKETIMAGLLLAFALHLEQVSQKWAQARAVARWRLAAPAVVIVAGGIYNYSYLALAWFGAVIALWGIIEAVVRPDVLRRQLSRRRLSETMPWIAATLGFGVLLVLPEVSQAVNFFGSIGVSPASGAIAKGNLGNLLYPLSPYEGLGIWSSADFRLASSNGFHAGQLSVLAVAVLVFGLVWALRRRQFLWPAAACAGGLIWWYSSRTQSPYVAAKALTIAAPLPIAVGLRALLTPDRRPLQARLLAALATAAFCIFALYSSTLALRNEPVQAPEAARELASYEHSIGNAPVLFLGVDDFAPWQLREAAVTTLSTPSYTQGQAATRVNKPFLGLQPLDFDNVLPSDLDTFRWVITSNTSFASQTPSNFRLYSIGPLYDLWQRVGPTTPHSVIETPGTPGAILDCHRTNLGRAKGVAAVMAQPLVLPGFQLSPGDATPFRFGVPAGRWQVSFQYTSPVSIEVDAQGARWTLPPYTGRPGPYVAVGTVMGQGIRRQITLIVRAARPSFLSGSNLRAMIWGFAATRSPDIRQIVPLRRACGKYVDWFRTA